MFIKVGGAKMRNAMLQGSRACRVKTVRDTHNRFRNMPCNRIHTTGTNTLSRSWKKTPVEIQVSVSKVYVTFCGAAAKLRARVTVC